MTNIRILIPLIFLFNIACQTSDSSVNQEKVGSSTNEEPSISTNSIPDELPEIVAHVNGEAIERDELERAVKSAEAKAGQAVPPQWRSEIYRTILDQLISFHLLRQESVDRNVMVDQGEIDTELDRIRHQFETEEIFHEQLKRWDITLEDLQNESRKDLLIRKMLNIETSSGVSIEEDELKAFYEQHADQFKIASNERPDRIPPFNEVKEQIRELIDRQERQFLIVDFLEKLRLQSDISIHI